MPTASKKPRGRPRKSAATPDTNPDVVTSAKKRTQTGVARGRKRKAAAAAVADKSDVEEETSPRRKTPRRSVSKAKYKESDSDDEAYVVDDDEDSKPEETKSNKKSTTRRKTPKRTPAKKKKTPKNEEEEDYKEGDECKGGESGDDDVKSTTSAKPPKRRMSTSNRPRVSSKEQFLQLKPGAKCVTKYGVVEIISDDQLPADHHKSKVTETEIKAARLVYRQLDKFNARKTKLLEEFAVGSRHRREELKKIYLDSIGPDAPTNDSDEAVTAQMKIWKQYCTTLTPEQILSDGKSWEDRKKPGKKTVYDSANEIDPRIPPDFYPDRIVKCKLVKDERTVIDVKEPKEGAIHLQYIERDPVEDSVVQLPIILSLTRRELTRAYDPEELNHVCSFCGEGNFKSRVHAKYHIDQGFCTDGKLLVKEDADKRVQIVENEALSGSCSTEKFLSKMHAVPAVKANVVSFKKMEEFGNPCKIKPSKRDKMPPWIVFNDKRSPLYPEMYITLGFRRGSQNRNFYNKQKLDDDYISKSERRIERKRRKRFSLPGTNNNFRPSTHASRFSSVKIEIVQPNDQGILPKIEDNMDASLPSLPPIDVAHASLPSLPPIDVTHAPLPSLPPIDVTGAPLPDLPPIDVTHAPLPDLHPATNVTGAPLPDLPPVSIVPHVPMPPMPSAAEIPNVPPIPPVAADTTVTTDAMDVDFGSNDNDSDVLETETTTQPSIVHEPSNKNNISSTNRVLPIEQRETSVPYPELGEGWTKRTVKRLNSSAIDTQYFSPDGWKFRSLLDARNYVNGKANKGQRARGRRKPSAVKNSYQPPKAQDQNNTDPPVVIDTQVLASECEAGRYPTINSFSGDHDDKCNLCHKPEKDDTAPLLECDFCKNSVHQVCLNKAMLRKEPPIVIREAEPHDSQLCHECLTVCLNRRARAETRRIRKWHHELQKAGLENIPDAAGLTEEVNLNNDDFETDQKEEDAPTYKACPTGGPGGLICCSYCSASYSRLLSNTAKEMEAQSIARKGQEVSEILELLADAKQRLLVATDLSRSNDERRSLMKNNEGAFSGGP